MLAPQTLLLQTVANLLSYPDFAPKEVRMVTPGSWNPERKEPDRGTQPWRLKERRGAWTWIAFVFIVVAIVSFIMRAPLM